MSTTSRFLLVRILTRCIRRHFSPQTRKRGHSRAALSDLSLREKAKRRRAVEGFQAFLVSSSHKPRAELRGEIELNHQGRNLQRSGIAGMRQVRIVLIWEPGEPIAPFGRTTCPEIRPPGQPRRHRITQITRGGINLTSADLVDLRFDQPFCREAILIGEGFGIQPSLSGVAAVDTAVDEHLFYL